MKMNRKKIGDICEQIIDYGFFIGLGYFIFLIMSIGVKYPGTFLLGGCFVLCLVIGGFIWGKGYKDDSKSI